MEMILRNRIVGVLLLVLSSFAFVSFALGANTYSADFEANSSQYFSDGATFGSDYTAITVQAWVKLESLPSSGNYMKIVNEYSADGKYLLTVRNNGGTPQWCFYFEPVTTGHTFVCENVTLVIGQWYHLQVSWLGDGSTVKIWRDCDLKTTSAVLTGAMVDGSTLFVVGRTADTSDSYFDGLVDDVRIWSVSKDTTACTDTWKTELVGNEANLTAYYKLNNDAVDSTGGTTLTNNNSVLYTTDIPDWGSSGGLDYYNYWVSVQIVSTTSDQALKYTLELLNFILISGIGGVFVYVGYMLIGNKKK